jgi:hypothetical protein
MFKANGSLTITGKKKEMAVKTVDRTLLRGQSVELLDATIKSQATLDPISKKVNRFSIEDGCKIS